MKFYLNGQKITTDEAMKLITKAQLAESKEAIENDPYQEVAYRTKAGYLVIEN